MSDVYTLEFTFGFTRVGFNKFCKCVLYVLVTFIRFSIKILNNRWHRLLFFVCSSARLIPFHGFLEWFVNLSKHCPEYCFMSWPFMAAVSRFSALYTFRFVSVGILILVVKALFFFSVDIHGFSCYRAVEVVYIYHISLEYSCSGAASKFGSKYGPILFQWNHWSAEFLHYLKKFKLTLLLGSFLICHDIMKIWRTLLSDQSLDKIYCLIYSHN